MSKRRMGGDFIKLLREKSNQYHKELQEHGEKAKGIGPVVVEQAGSGDTTDTGGGADVLQAPSQDQEAPPKHNVEVKKRTRRKPAVKRRKK